MADSKFIFGFGSLICRPSLLATAPSATGIRSAYIKGFTRCFNFWDAIGYTETNLDVANEPMCALDVARSSDMRARVNGVVFTVGEPDLTRLLKREEGYELIRVPVYDYETDQLLSDECLVFSANKNDGRYVFDGVAQRRYLEDYLDAARAYGDTFYQELLDTTFIDGKTLRQVTHVATLL